MNPGDVVDGRYRLTRMAGRGAMSEVWVAEDTRLERRVALKVLTAPSSELAEARAIAQLQHPNIVSVFDAGEADGRAYLVLEYIDGSTAREIFSATGAFSEGEVRRFGAQLAAALQYAHQHGVIHGDIKPENVMITADGAAKLTDFGTARMFTSTTLTPEQAREVMGTIAYLSPEVLVGAAPDARADIYSLGLTLYELAAGRLPFGGSPAAAAAQRMNRGLPPVRELAPGLTPGFERALAGATATDPALRFQSAGQLAGALREATESRPPVAPAPPPVQRSAPPVQSAPPPRAPSPRPGEQRHSGVSGWQIAAIVGIGLAVLAAIGGAAAYVLNQDGDSNPPAVTPTPRPTSAPTLPPRATSTVTPAPTATKPAPTSAPSPSATATATASPTRTPTAGATSTPTRTPTPPAVTATPTSSTPTATQNPNLTPTPTP